MSPVAEALHDHLLDGLARALTCYRWETADRLAAALAVLIEELVGP